MEKGKEFIDSLFGRNRGRSNQSTSSEQSSGPVITNGIVSGVVTDADGSPVRGVEVELLVAREGEQERISKSATTDGSGFYYFADVQEGDYTIRVTTDVSTYTEALTVAQQYSQVDIRIAREQSRAETETSEEPSKAQVEPTAEPPQIQSEPGNAYCKECGANLPAGSRFCPFCGRPAY